MPLSDIITINIVTETAGVTAAGFGVILILSADAAFVERVRSYTSITALAVDFASTTGTYKAANAIFAQNPKVEKVMVGRLALKPTQQWAIDIGTAGVLNSTAYKVQVRSNIATFTSDASATEAEIIAGLVSAINALSGDTVTASDQTTFLRIAGNTAGSWDRVMVLNPDGNPDVGVYLSITPDHADPGVATDLAAIAAVDNTWYAIVNPWGSKLMNLAIAAYAESAKKLFLCDVQDSATITAAAGGTDLADELKDAAYARTAAIYHPDNEAMAAAAWGGKCLPFDPGSETWKFKTLAGVSAASLTATHQTNLEAKRCNYYYNVAGVNITSQGVVAANEFIDVIRFRDWLEARMSERIFFRLATLKKIPYTDRGYAVIEGEIRAQLDEGVDVGGLSSDPAPVVTVPKVIDANPVDKAARLARGFLFNATLAGAIHKLVINGTITV